MLQKLRDKSSGWIATTIIVLLMVPFLFVIDASYLGGVGANNVARVQAPPSWWRSAPSFWPVSTLWRNANITSEDFRIRFEQARMAAREQQGDAFDPRQFESLENKKAVLEQLIDEQVVRLAADEAGIVIGDAAVAAYIQQIPAFQRDGKFDPDQYRLALAQGGVARTPAAFDALVRDSLKQSVIPSALERSGFVTAGEAERLFKLLGQTRDIELAVLDPIAADPSKVSDEQVQQWYAANGEDFRQPEQVSVEYVEVLASDLPPPVPADEATLRSRYEAEKSRFVAPEQRRAAHILISAGSDKDAARAKAADLAEQVRNGADFAALARTHSEDPGSKDLGGELGWVERGVMVGAFEEALFAMAAGEVRGPVETDFGFHVLKLEEVQGGQGKPFEEVRDQLAAEQLQADADGAFAELSGKLVDEVYRNPTALAPAAEVAGLTLKTAGPYSRDQAPGILANSQLLRAAFSEVLIADGTVSDPIEIAPGHTVMLRVTAHQAEAPLPLEQVRDQVVAAVAADVAAKAMQAKAQELIAQIGEGSLAEAAAKAGVQVQALAALPRGVPVPGAEANAAIFRATPPVDGKPVYGAVAMDDGRHAVFALTKVTPGDVSQVPEAQRGLLAEQLSQIDGNNAAEAYIRGMRERFKIQVSEDQL
jgi:peptidyl-prolyl cis-trans isomerase D